jgi:hypothetical protein
MEHAVEKASLNRQRFSPPLLFVSSVFLSEWYAVFCTRVSETSDRVNYICVGNLGRSSIEVPASGRHSSQRLAEECTVTCCGWVSCTWFTASDIPAATAGFVSSTCLSCRFSASRYGRLLRTWCVAPHKFKLDALTYICNVSVCIAGRRQCYRHFRDFLQVLAVCVAPMYKRLRAARWWQWTRGSVVGWGTVLQAGRSLLDSRWGHRFSSIDLTLPAALWPWGSTQPLTEMSTRNLPETDNLTAVCEPAT